MGLGVIDDIGKEFLAERGQRYHHASGMLQGAVDLPLPAPQSLPGLQPPATVRVAVVGAHLSGMPLNSQLTERQATLVASTSTAADYRLFALPGTVPPKPGLLRVAPGSGAAIALEVWEMPLAYYGSFVALIPAPLGIGSLALADGSSVQVIICEPKAQHGSLDNSHLGGRRAYIASRASGG